MSFDQLEAENTSIVDMNRPRCDRLSGGLGLAFLALRNDEEFGNPGLNINVEVETSPRFTTSVADRPNDAGSGFEEGAINGKDLAVELTERLGGFGRTWLENFASQVIENGL